MKKILFATVILLAALVLKVESQSTASYGFLVESLNTTSADSVIGTSFAVPQGSATMITWTVVNDGSAHTTILQTSADNVSWFTVDTNTDVGGGIRNYGFTGIKFVRIRQVSRTGGTTSSGTILTSRAFPTTTAVTGGGGANLSGNLLFSPDNTFSIGVVGASRPNNIYAAGNIYTGGNFEASVGGAFYWAGSSVIRNSSNGVIRLLDGAETTFNRLQFGGTTSAFPSLKRTGTHIDLRLADDSGATGLIVSSIGVGGSATPGPGGLITFGVYTFAVLPSPVDGSIGYCSDCTIASPCAGAGTGAIAKRLNGIWVCN